jgi:hypothetical protein
LHQVETSENHSEYGSENLKEGILLLAVAEGRIKMAADGAECGDCSYPSCKND